VATQHAIDEADIRQRIDEWAAAIRSMELEGVMAIYASDRTDFWLRWTPCFRKVDGNWLIAHEQLSVPVDPESGSALLNLKP
jgi:ketosteroid isomerase-like protein